MQIDILEKLLTYYKIDFDIFFTSIYAKKHNNLESKEKEEQEREDGKSVKNSFDYSTDADNIDYYRVDIMGISKNKWLLINAFY